MANIVVMGGGTGMGVVLQSLKGHNHNLTALVSMIATGGSTGRLRYDLGVHPVGNVRQALIALADISDIYQDAIKYRFTEGELKGHNAGNLYLAVFEKITGDFEKAIEIAEQEWKVKGKVIPLTKEVVDICVTLENGELICGERNIDQLNFNKDVAITNLFLEPSVSISDKACKEIEKADYIIFGPGDFYYLISSFLVDGFIDCVQRSHAKKIFVCNAMNRYGITTHYTLTDYIMKLEEYLGKDAFDFIIYNTQRLDELISQKPILTLDSFVTYNKHDFVNYRGEIICRDLLSDKLYEHEDADEAYRSSIRHDVAKLGNVFNEIMNK